MVACFIGYIVQAIINNFIPLLFVMFQSSYGIPLNRIALLVSANFIVQLAVDLLAVQFADRIGYRPLLMVAHTFAALGLLLLTVLPDRMDPFSGILISVVVYAVGGGMIEVLVSPVMEGCPTDHKSAAMSLLHSFYCWGHVGVVLISVAFFHVAGIANWRALTYLWAAVPLINMVLFIQAPISLPTESGEKGMSGRQLLGNRTFRVLFAMMFCAGACEQGLIQWASAFAERSLGIQKTIGDLAGPMMFAVCMGLARLYYGKYGSRISLDRFVTGSVILCACAYLLTGLSPLAGLSLAGCAICGFSVGILWPGTYSKAAAALRNGGTAMFALLAVAGDLGCAAGPAMVGVVAEWFSGRIRVGIVAAAVFPLLMLLSLWTEKRIATSEGK